MKFTQIPADTFQRIQLNAGVLLSDFDPKTGELQNENIIGATTGGVSFAATPEFSDYGEDIDNCPKNMKELKKLDSWEVKISGNFVTADSKSAKRLIGAADEANGKVTPRNDVKLSDFEDIWWVGDYGEGDDNFLAIKMINALSTGGFQIQSTDNGKGQLSFEFTGHYSMSNQDQVPFEVYVKDSETNFETLRGTGYKVATKADPNEDDKK